MFLKSTSLVVAALAVVGELRGQSVAKTEPVGWIAVTAEGVSDTLVSLPLHRPEEFLGELAAANGDLLTVAGASFAEDAFNGLHYVLVGSGPAEGRWYRIVDTAPSSLTVDLAGDDPEALLDPGTRIAIIPFWTLDSVFPDGVGVHASDSLLPKTRVLLPDSQSAGIKLAPTESFFYFGGVDHGGEGWRKSGSAPTVKFDDLILNPDLSFVIRHEIPGDTAIEIAGAVQMTTLASRLGTLEGGMPQDHSLSFKGALPLSLAASGLIESGAFAGSGVLDQPVDQLLVFDHSLPAKNRVPALAYYYYTGTSGGGPGWRVQGDPTTSHDGTEVFQPASALLLRKAATPQPTSGYWTFRPSYVP